MWVGVFCEVVVVGVLVDWFVVVVLFCCLLGLLILYMVIILYSKDCIVDSLVVFVCD